MLRWFVIHTRPNAEKQAEWHLRNQAFADVYLPCYRKRRSHARKIEWVTAPVFPRYLFVRMDTETAQWRAIRSTVGVVDIVRNADRPAPVPEGIVEAIRAREGDDGLLALTAKFARGESVHICGGAFDGQNGLFECEDDEKRVVVLLDLLGRSVRVRVAADAVARAA